MKQLFTLLSALLLSTMALSAQSTPVSWTFETKKVNDTEYDLVFTAAIQDGWVIYSQHTEDGGPIPTSFQFSAVDGFLPVGTTTESGDKKEGMDPLFGVNVIKLGGTATFTQRIERVGDINNITGFLTYMTCDGEKCLPPTDVDFSFEL